jgi:tetratricopeptide (TPR) repeat protein
MQQEADLQVVSKVFLVFDLARNSPKPSTGGLLLNDVIDARVPPEAQKEFSRGRTALANKNADEAIDHLQKATFLYPQYFEAQLLLATAHMDKRQWDKAESVLQQALEIKPDDATVFIALGEVSWRQKNYADAERLLLEGLKRDDKSWHGFFTLGRLYLDQGDVAKAGPPIGKTLQLKPDFAEAHLLAGNILLHFKQQERALVEYQEYLRLAPKGEFAPQANDLVKQINKAIAERQK